VSNRYRPPSPVQHQYSSGGAKEVTHCGVGDLVSKYAAATLELLKRFNFELLKFNTA